MWDIWFAKALSNWNLLQIKDGNIFVHKYLLYSIKIWNYENNLHWRINYKDINDILC